MQARRNWGWRARLAEIQACIAGGPQAFEAWQAERLAAHLAWARRAIPWFRERAPAEDDLSRWPILRREDLQVHYDALRDSTRPLKSLLPDSSGGSTGEPVRFLHDGAYWRWVVAQEVAFHQWWGVEPWARTAYLWGADRDLHMSWKDRLEMRLLGRVVLDAFRMDDERMEAFAYRCRKLNPTILQGYATALDLFARWVESHGGAGFQLRVIRSAAETLRPEVRKRLSKVFGAPVRDVYGSRETAGIAAECAHGRLHVLAHGKVVEILDEHGAPCPPGTPGRVLVTDLTNRAFGFIRYENGDVAAWSTRSTCVCGVPYPALERVYGRTSDFLTGADGRHVHGEFFTHLFYGRSDVKRFQVRQPSRDLVEVQTVGSITEAAIAPLLLAMREQLGPGVLVTWQSVDQISVPPSGKHRFTVSEVPYLPGDAP
jgi:phenylacetate-CoA ligase